MYLLKSVSASRKGSALFQFAIMILKLMSLITVYDLANWRIISTDILLGDFFNCRFIDGVFKVVESFVIGILL